MFNRFLSENLSVIIDSFFSSNYKADILLASFFKKHRIGKRDREWLRSRFFYFIRHKYFVEYFANNGKNIPETICMLIDNEPDDAMEKKHKLFNRLPRSEQLFLESSFPEWLYKKAATSNVPFGWLNNRARTTIRTNSRIKRSELAAVLSPQGIVCEETPFSPYGLAVISGENQLKNTKEFENGFFDFQDESSQLAALLVNNSHKTLLDSCAGGGGKTVAIASAFPKMIITATDSRQYLFSEIKRRSDTAGLNNVKTVKIEDLKNFRFDTVFIDAPCTGSGVLRRNPEDRWRLKEEDIADFVTKQRQCLEDYSKLVNKNGELIYITCSFFAEENKDNINCFLSNNKNFSIVSASERLKENICSCIETGIITDGLFFATAPGYERDSFFGAILRKNS